MFLVLPDTGNQLDNAVCHWGSVSLWLWLCQKIIGKQIYGKMFKTL